MKNILITLLLAATAVAETPKQETTKADNTKRNATDQATAEDQGGSVADREVTKKIRHSLVKTDGLSTMAKNVKIITMGGNVTLRGPVKSDAEKITIASLAEKVAGKGKVVNQLEVKKSE